MSELESTLPLNPQEAEQFSPQERILSVARELFCRDGIRATGIDRILAEAGVSKMTLYNRFGSKTALLRAVLLEEGEDWRTRFFGQLQAEGTTPAAHLRAIVPALGRWFTGGKFYGCAFMKAVAEHQNDEPWLRDLAAAHHKEILNQLSELAAQAGYAKTKLLARQLLLLIDGTITALMVSGDPTVLDISAQNLEAILTTAERSDS
jgi:AcrR family transcriptional regulator